jgi:predicted metal-binding protein
MKKFFTLVAMALMAVGANAQSVVAEIDWTQESEWPADVWFSTDYAAVSVETGTGLIIDCSSDGTTNYWEPQVPMIAKIPLIEEGGQYQVKFTVNSPAAGEIRLDFASWETGATKDAIFPVEAGEQSFEIPFLDYPTEATNAMIFYQCGKIPGRHIITKVQVIDLEGEGGEGGEGGEQGGEGGEGGSGIVAEVDWTQESEWPADVWFSTDYAAVSVETGTGLIIDCSSDGTTNYWEPQVPMIAKIPLIEEGGQYQVNFTVNSPAAGEIRLDFASWETGATKDAIFPVEAGEQSFEIPFLDYPTEATNAMIFYQCGKIPGRHIITKVQVIDLEGSGIKNVKAANALNNVRYNLAGQKVDASYKGIVIMNGKKFMQK